MGSSPQDEWPGGIAATTLFFEDLEAARAFYAEVFGLPVVYEDDDSTVFRFGETAGVRFQFTLDVDDVDAMCGQLAQRGVTLLNGPIDRPWGVRTASFRDPGGHVWEIAH
jgi:catechol 2,3-dioxygenase-like lactoylglutathione lyase family enzyme